MSVELSETHPERKRSLVILKFATPAVLRRYTSSGPAEHNAAGWLRKQTWRIASNPEARNQSAPQCSDPENHRRKSRSDEVIEGIKYVDKDRTCDKRRDGVRVTERERERES